mmetsp:Transcript_21078/g.66271  ORF Transcript_21078/g.66271 Transcript_21078/m.66271 type:complete len:309 (+) Transcript_21078:184-1110(+)
MRSARTPARRARSWTRSCAGSTRSSCESCGTPRSRNFGDGRPPRSRPSTSIGAWSRPSGDSSPTPNSRRARTPRGRTTRCAPSSGRPSAPSPPSPPRLAPPSSRPRSSAPNTSPYSASSSPSSKRRPRRISASTRPSTPPSPGESPRPTSTSAPASRKPRPLSSSPSSQTTPPRFSGPAASTNPKLARAPSPSPTRLTSTRRPNALRLPRPRSLPRGTYYYSLSEQLVPFQRPCFARVRGALGMGEKGISVSARSLRLCVPGRAQSCRDAHSRDPHAEENPTKPDTVVRRGCGETRAASRSGRDLEGE